MLPLDETFADYEDRLDLALQQICKVNDWSIDKLALKVLQTRSDVLLIKVDQAMLDDSIPLRQAENLLSGSIAMLLSAARSTISPRAHHQGKAPDLVKDFVENEVRMSHTQRGSFTLTIVTRLDLNQEKTFLLGMANLTRRPLQ